MSVNVSGRPSQLTLFHMYASPGCCQILLTLPKTGGHPQGVVSSESQPKYPPAATAASEHPTWVNSMLQRMRATTAMLWSARWRVVSAAYGVVAAMKKSGATRRMYVEHRSSTAYTPTRYIAR
jgi:hypothetical protein